MSRRPRRSQQGNLRVANLFVSRPSGLAIQLSGKVANGHFMAVGFFDVAFARRGRMLLALAKGAANDIAFRQTEE